jgi:KTSC domain
MLGWQDVEAGKLAGVIAQHKYDAVQKTLSIKFKDGRIWVHSGVSQELYNQMCASHQPAAFWAGAIRQATKGDSGPKLYPVIHARAE